MGVRTDALAVFGAILLIARYVGLFSCDELDLMKKRYKNVIALLIARYVGLFSCDAFC